MGLYAVSDRQVDAYTEDCLHIMYTYVIFQAVMTVLVFQATKDFKNFIILLLRVC